MDLKQRLLEELNLQSMTKTVTELSHFHRYSGLSGGEKAADYLENLLKAMGIPVEMCQYEGYYSIPVSASVMIEGRRFDLIADVYSSEANALTGELYYDSMSKKSQLSRAEEAERFQSFQNKIVLTWANKGDFAARARQNGAKAILHISASKGGYIHHRNIGSVWGTPTLDDGPWMKFLPSAGLSFEDGEYLIQALEERALYGELTIQMNTGLRTSRFPVVDIPGSEAGFVLVSGHYDSWYEGVTDNACSNAIMLEYARIFWENRSLLKRGIRLAWWSGHSDGRFAGSAWYNDTHFQDLYDHCMAHINLDLAGGKNADQISVRTTCMEGLNCTADLIEQYTKQRPQRYIPMIRGADQSFWGANIPIHIMLKYEPLPENRLSNCPGGGPWWHTNQDTLDKMDETILLRDAKINGELICRFAQKDIPTDLDGFLADMSVRIEALAKQLPDEFDLAPVLTAISELRTAFQKYCEQVGENIPDQVLKRTAGIVNRIFYSKCDAFQQPRSSQFGLLVGLSAGKNSSKEHMESLEYRMLFTDFLRQRNRMVVELNEVKQYVNTLIVR